MPESSIAVDTSRLIRQASVLRHYMDTIDWRRFRPMPDIVVINAYADSDCTWRVSLMPLSQSISRTAFEVAQRPSLDAGDGTGHAISAQQQSSKASLVISPQRRLTRRLSWRRVEITFYRSLQRAKEWAALASSLVVTRR